MVNNKSKSLIRRYQNYLVRKTEQNYWRQIFYLLERKSGCTLLDCGCNDGEITLKIARLIGAIKVYGIDIDGEALNKAKNKGIIAYKADLNERFPLDGESVDVVFSNQVIEHLTNTLNFVREIYRVLKPNGYAVISTENLANWANILALTLGWQPFSSKLGLGNPFIFTGIEGRTEEWAFNTKLAEADIWKGYGYGVHNKVLAYRGLIDIFKMNGFKIEKICGVGYYPFPEIVGRFLSNIDPRHAFYLILKARKSEK